MKVRLAAATLTAPQVIDGLGSIVVYDDFGTPILLVQKMADGLILSYSPTDPQFTVAMSALGIGLNGKRYTRMESHGPRKTSTSPQKA